MVNQKLKLLLKRRTIQGFIIGVIVALTSLAFSFFGARPISITFSELSVRRLINSQALCPQFGQYFIDGMQNMMALSESDSLIFGMVFIGIIVTPVIALLFGAIVHYFLWSFHIGNLFKKGVSKIFLELIIGILPLSVLFYFLTGIPFYGILIALIIYLSIALTIFTGLNMLKIITIKWE